MSIRIQRCYDSHLHLLATGQMQAMLQLSSLKTPQQISTLEIKKEFFRDDWLIGFGWDQHQFPDGKFPTRQDLDQIFPKTPVAFSRVDGHAMWVNTEALRRAGLLKPVREWNLPTGGEAHEDQQGMPSGILIDRAMEFINACLPIEDQSTKIGFLKSAMQLFNREGFTHLRDMGGDEGQWQALVTLEDRKELSIYLEQNFVFEKPEDFEKTLLLCQKASKDRYSHLKVKGPKFYLDGALGSEGAALSQPYQGTSNRGFLIWSREQVSEWIQKTWEQDFEISIHAIGDRASHLVVEEAVKIWNSGLRGVLNLEHAEVMRSETIDLLKGRSARLHIQPCHWLNDRKWLAQKLGTLNQSVFPWRYASESGIALSWGSDSPIERACLQDNQIALQESSTTIPSYPDQWWKPHEHPDLNWGAQCATEYENGKIARVIFDGEPLHF